MAQVEAALFTVGVFKDIAWAERGIDALKQQGFAAERMTLAAKASTESAALIERALGAAPESVELPVVGAAVVRGPSRTRSTDLAATWSRSAWRPRCGGLASSPTTG